MNSLQMLDCDMETYKSYGLGPYEGRYEKRMDYNPKKIFPSIAKHLGPRDPELSWVVDANGNILQYLGDKFLGAFRIATDDEVARLSKNGITMHESREPCPFIKSGQYLIRI